MSIATLQVRSFTGVGKMKADGGVRFHYQVGG